MRHSRIELLRAGVRGAAAEAYVKLADEAVADKDEEPVMETGHFVLSGVIVENDWAWFKSDVTPSLFRGWLDEQSGDIQVSFNSPGGSYQAGVEMMDAWSQYSGGSKTARITAAYSAASVMALGADRVEMVEGGTVLIHNAWTYGEGDYIEFRKIADELEELAKGLVPLYQTRMSWEDAKLKKALDDQTMLNADTCVESGFADAIVGRPEDPEGQEMSARRQALRSTRARMARFTQGAAGR